MYLSPEKLEVNQDMLRRIRDTVGIACFAVDECVRASLCSFADSVGCGLQRLAFDSPILHNTHTPHTSHIDATASRNGTSAGPRPPPTPPRFFHPVTSPATHSPTLKIKGPFLPVLLPEALLPPGAVRASAHHRPLRHRHAPRAGPFVPCVSGIVTTCRSCVRVVCARKMIGTPVQRLPIPLSATIHPSVHPQTRSTKKQSSPHTNTHTGGRGDAAPAGGPLHRAHHRQPPQPPLRRA